MLENSLLMNLLKEKLNYTSERHKVIASNIANISTPKARSMDLANFNKVLKGKILSLKLTSKNHIDKSNTQNNFLVFSPEKTEEKINGNNINLDNETIKLNKNNLEYQQALGIYNKILSIFRTITN